MKTLLLPLSLLLATSGCGVLKAADSANAVPGKMDSMNQKMSEMSEKIDQTNDKIHKTNEAIHLQALKFAMDDMLKPENTKYLQPPIDMMVGGKAFAEEVRAEEILLLIKAKFLGISYDVVNDFDPACAKVDVQACDKAKYDLDLKKVVDYSMLLVVAGFLPQPLVEQIVATQIPHGQYVEEVYKLLFLRFAMLADVRIGQMAMAPGFKLSSPDRLREAVDRVAELHYIAVQRFAAKIAIRITAFHAPFADEYNFDGSPVEVATVPPLWTRLENAFTMELDPTSVVDPVSLRLLEELRVRVKNRR